MLPSVDPFVCEDWVFILGNSKSMHDTFWGRCKHVIRCGIYAQSGDLMYFLVGEFLFSGKNKHSFLNWSDEELKFLGFTYIFERSIPCFDTWLCLAFGEIFHFLQLFSLSFVWMFLLCFYIHTCHFQRLHY